LTGGDYHVLRSCECEAEPLAINADVVVLGHVERVLR